MLGVGSQETNKKAAANNDDVCQQLRRGVLPPPRRKVMAMPRSCAPPPAPISPRTRLVRAQRIIFRARIEAGSGLDISIWARPSALGYPTWPIGKLCASVLVCTCTCTAKLSVTSVKLKSLIPSTRPRRCVHFIKRQKKKDAMWFTAEICERWGLNPCDRSHCNLSATP